MKCRDESVEPEEDSTWEVALKILNYLAENPKAADTVDGILQWWLLDQTIIEEEERVAQALKCLVERDLLVTVQASDSRRHYQLNAERIEETRRLIREAKNRRA
ncbi:MAG TPA: hypothetical protein VFS10_08495 [Pyrinomonadaceae bacterium]|nr:hypothetical protein [Pyrinomonadaceae bacterium]